MFMTKNLLRRPVSSLNIEMFTTVLQALHCMCFLIFFFKFNCKLDSVFILFAEGSSNIEANFNKRYVRQKLEHGRSRIWGDVQQKVRVYLLSTDLSYFKYDEFIQVLDIVNRYI